MECEPQPAMIGKEGPTASRAVEMSCARSSRVKRKASELVPRMTRPASPVVER